MRVLASILLSASLAFASGIAWAAEPPSAEVAAAYAAIPHRLTQFDAASSTAAQKAELARLFAYTDRGVVLRVQGMQAHGARSADGVRRAVAGYESLIAELGKEKFSPEVAPARALIVEALQLQQRHLQSRPEGGLVFTRAQITSVREVQDASGRLLKAYNLLMRGFPGETQRNKTSFYDHLCALDFL